MPDWEVKSESPAEGGDWQVASEAPAGPPNAAEDIVKSTGVGLGRGMIGLAGMPGDIAEYGARGINAAVQGVGRLTGLDVGPSRAPQAPTFGSEAIQRGVEQTTGPFREPQTLAGKYAQTVGEFLPAAIGGPESLASRVFSRAIVPGIAAETAGQVAEQVAPEYAPLARTAVGIASGLRTKGSKFAVPTLQDLEKEGSRLYSHPEVAAVKIDPTAVHRELSDIKNSLENMVDPDLMKGTWSQLSKEQAQHAPTQAGAMAALTKVKPSAKPDVAIDDLDTLRKQLSKVARDYTPSRTGEDRMAASIAIGRIDDFMANLKQPDLTAGDAAKAMPILQEARDNWAAARRVETADKKIASALLRAGTTYSGQNVENAIRQNLRRIIDPDSPAAKRLRGGWSNLEVDRAKDIVEGGELSNILRMVGNKLAGPHGLAGGAFLAAEELMRGSPGRAFVYGMGLPALGYGVKAAGNIRTYRKAQGLTEELAKRSPLFQQWQGQGRMAPVPPLPQILGTATYSQPLLQGRLKGGRVMKRFRYRTPSKSR